MSGIDYLYKRRKKDALLGLNYWTLFCEKTKFCGNDLVIVLSKEKKINTYIVNNLDAIQEQYKTRIIYLMSEFNEALSFRDCRIKTIKISKKEKKCLSSFFRMYKFTNRIIFADTLDVAEVDPMELVSYGVLTFDDVVQRGILGITGYSSTQTKDKVTFECAMKEMEKGYDIFKRIKKKYVNDYFFYNNRASGNTYLMAMYLDEFVIKNALKNYIIINTRESSEKICKLLGMRSVLLEMDRHEQSEFERFIFFMKEEEISLKTLNPYNHHVNMITLRGYKGLDFHTAYRSLLYNCNKEKKPKKIISKDTEYIFKDRQLKKGRTVLFSINSYSIDNIKLDFWLNLIKRIKNEGFDVCLNISKGEENDIDIEKVSIPYDEIIDFVEKAGFFVGVRSGLCDLISQTKSKMFVIYNTNEMMKDYFSLENMGFRKDNIREVLFKDNNELQSEIVAFIQEKD